MIDGLMTAQAVPAEAAGDYWSMLFVFVLATFIGLGVIRRVSRLLYTPLMSLTNAISAIAVVGSNVVTGADHLRAVLDERSENGAPRRDRRGHGHDRRGRRDLDPARNHPSRLDRRCHRRGIRRRRTAVPGAPHRRAAADCPVACLRRSRRRPRRHRGILPLVG